MHEIGPPLPLEDAQAEGEEIARGGLVAGPLQGVGDERAVAHPAIRIVLADMRSDVPIDRGDDRAALIAKRADGEQRSPVERHELGREVREMVAVTRHPDPPEIGGALDDPLRPQHHQPRVVLADLGLALAEAEIEVDGLRLARSELDVELDGRIDGAVLHRLVAQAPRLTGAPDALEAHHLLMTGCVVIDAVDAVFAAAGEQPAIVAVAEDAAQLGVEDGGVLPLASFERRVLVQKEAYVARLVGEVHDRDALDVDVAVIIDDVRAMQLDAELFVHEADVGDERLGEVAHRSLEARIAGPSEGAIHPDAKAPGPAPRLVLPAYLGEVDLADRVIGSEVDMEARLIADGLVSEREVAGHGAARLAELVPANGGRWGG